MSEAREVIARVACNKAHAWGELLHDWDDTGENTRDAFRITADAILAALDEAGWVLIRSDSWRLGQVRPSTRRENR